MSITLASIIAASATLPSTDPRIIGELKYGYRLDPDADTIVGQLDDVTKEIEIFDKPREYNGDFYDQGSCFLVVTLGELDERFTDSGRSTPRTEPSHVLMTVKTFDKEGKPVNKTIEALNNAQVIKDVAGRELGSDRKFVKDGSTYGGHYRSKDGKGTITLEPLNF